RFASPVEGARDRVVLHERKKSGPAMNDRATSDHATTEGHYPIAPLASERRGVGHPGTPIEGVPLGTRAGHSAGGRHFPHQLHMRIVRSPKAHARIISVDASAALALPGVHAVWANADIADLSPIDFRGDKSGEGIRQFRQPALAKTYVRYIGDPVAAV